jgi:hypothetical protein
MRASRYGSRSMSRRPLALTLVSAALLAGCGSSSNHASSASKGASTSANTSTGTASTGASTGTASTSAATGTGSTPATTPGQLSYEHVPIEQGRDIAPPSTTQTGTVDGLPCGAKEQLIYHIHAHLAVFVNGQSRSLPAGIGIPGSQVAQTTQGPVAEGGQCIYWLHTHAPDGVIHVESPTRRVYTLGNFFDEWHQPLSKHRIGTIAGPLTFIVGGKLWKRNPRSIPLLPHLLIQVDTGQPSPPVAKVNWSQTGL